MTALSARRALNGSSASTARGSFHRRNAARGVVEIIQVVHDSLESAFDGSDSALAEVYLRFASENPAFMETTVRRATSYWNCYYRFGYPNRMDYLAFPVLRWLQSQVA